MTKLYVRQITEYEIEVSGDNQKELADSIYAGMEEGCNENLKETEALRKQVNIGFAMQDISAKCINLNMTIYRGFGDD